jgi:hypothetical protein
MIAVAAGTVSSFDFFSTLSTLVTKGYGMKSFFVILGVIVALALAIGGIWLANNTKNQMAIVNVFSEQSKAAMKFQAELKGNNGQEQRPEMKRSRFQIQQEALKNYAQALQSIDYSSCPKKFKLVWFDYVSSVADLSDKNFTTMTVKDLLELGMSAYTRDGKLTQDVIQDTDSLKRPVLLLRRCQRIAISYGVSFRPLANQQ